MEIVDSLPPAMRGKVIGVSALKLVNEGMAKWSDFVTQSRIRPLHEVVDRLGLSVKTLVDAGIKNSVATAAHAAVHTPVHLAAEAQRKVLTEKLVAAGVHADRLVDVLAKGLAERAAIAAGPGSITKAGVQLPNAWQGGRIIAPNGGHAAELARVLAGMKLAGGAIVVPKKKPPEPPAAAAAVAAPKPPEGPAPSTAAIDWNDPDNAKGRVALATKSIFGRPLTEQEIANLMGLDSGTMRIQVFEKGTELLRGISTSKAMTYEVEVKGVAKKADVLRSFKVNAKGEKILDAQAFFVEKEHQGQGIGADVFDRMVGEAKRLGVDKIQTHAVRGKDSNGYYTWGRFGYDGPLPPESIAKLPPGLSTATKLSDLMATPEGSEWWKKNGKSINLTFDLKPGSQSRQVWDAYLAEKKAATAATASSMPTSATKTSKLPTGPGRISPMTPPPTPAVIPGNPSAARDFKVVAQTEEQLLAWDGEHYAEWRRGLPTGETKAIGSYATSGYISINGVLRDEPGLLESLGRNAGHVKQEIARIDAALESAPRVPEDMTVYRGVKLAPVLEKMGITRADLKPGMDIVDGGFVSTSPAEEFVKHGTAVLEIRVKKGTVGAMINPVEGELLLGRDIKLRVVSISGAGTRAEKARIVVEAIPVARREP